jgi:hypothetical protein
MVPCERTEQEIRRESRDSVQAYAERRGLVPESEIVPRAEPARPRRGLFAGAEVGGKPVPSGAFPCDLAVADDRKSRGGPAGAVGGRLCAGLGGC